MKNTKKKRLYKGLKKGSFNQRVFSMLTSLMKKNAQGAKSAFNIFCDLPVGAMLERKSLSRYYSDLEDSMPSGKELSEWAIKRAIKELSVSKYIKIKQDKTGKADTRISLVKKGVLEFIKCNVAIQKQKKEWDGKWRIIIFDIREDRRRIRDSLRNRLNWLGFKELQKSVWIFPYNIRKEIEEILDICNINIIGDVRFLTVEKISKDEDLKKEFELK